MAKNKVEVFLGGEQVLISSVDKKKVDVKSDKKVTPIILINRSNHSEYYSYDNEKRMISPKAQALLGDEAKLDKESLNPNLLIKKLK
jgi:hypothetical protein